MPRKPTREEVAKIAANYKELRQNVTRTGTLALQLIAHPDVSEAMLLDVAYRYRKSFSLLREVHNDCNTKIGQSGSTFRPHPWETPL